MSDALETRLKEQAHQLGFAHVGIAPASEADGFERLRVWLDHGYAGEMAYLHKFAEQRRHPRGVLPQVRSVLMAALRYAADDSADKEPLPQPLPGTERGDTEPSDSPVRIGEGRGEGLHDGSTAISASPGAPLLPVAARIARYARGPDYHDVIWDRLNTLRAWLEEQVPECVVRGVCDTAPLLERDFARRAGLGWFGKNTMLIDKREGSYFLLGALLTNLELTPDAPFTAQHCGTCTACLDACPTDAFPAPGVLDARRCISYLTIELRGPVPVELRPGIGDWLFGCDVCQEVCPWNRRPAAGSPALAARADLAALDPIELLGLSDAEFRRRFRGTALFRTRRTGLLRNAALVLGNVGGPEALPALRQALGDADAVVRDAAAWALEQIERRQSLQ